MRKLLLLSAVAFVCFSSVAAVRQENLMDEVKSLVNSRLEYADLSSKALENIRKMLHEQPGLNPEVINKVLTVLQCSNAYNITRNNILSVIDYSLPSNEKRLWIFNLKEQKLLFHTYVAHGIKSGTLLTDSFSNINNSRSSSMGLYKTEKSYYGREGLSLRLDGLDQGFNNNASNRSIVMHGAWYLNENFIKKYGRAGRSWGCPAVPLELANPIINTIKDNSLFIAYYPDDNWFLKSRFLNCSKTRPLQNTVGLSVTKPAIVVNPRDNILFVDMKKNHKHVDTDPVLAMSAEYYMQTFHLPAPLERMLRRQIDNVEYIVLSDNEFRHLLTSNKIDAKACLEHIHFVIPHLIKHGGYFATEMKILDLGKIQQITHIAPLPLLVKATNSYTVQFEKTPPITLKSTSDFIRWLGL